VKPPRLPKEPSRVLLRPTICWCINQTLLCKIKNNSKKSESSNCRLRTYNDFLSDQIVLLGFLMAVRMEKLWKYASCTCMCMPVDKGLGLSHRSMIRSAFITFEMHFHPKFIWAKVNDLILIYAPFPMKIITNTKVHFI